MTKVMPIPMKATGIAEISTLTDGGAVLSKNPSRLEFIDALRGFACVWVLLCHVQGYWIDRHPVTATGPIKWIDAAVEGFCKVGVAGVDLFIVLSGFCLYWPVIRAWRRGTEFQPRVFFMRRARRIMPAYYVAVLFCTAIALYPPLQQHYVPRSPRLIDVASYLGFVMTFVPYHLTTVNGTYWSIALEVQLYVCFPFAVWLARRSGIRAVILLAIAVTGFWQIFQWSGIGLRLGISPVAYIYHLPARYFEFVAGMVAAHLTAAPLPRQARIAAVSAFFALPVALMCAKFGITTWSEVLYSSWGIVFAGVIICLAELHSDWFISPVRAGLFTRVGIVSYSLYLIHAPIMLLATGSVLAAANRYHAGPLSIIAGFLILGVPLLTTAAYGFYLLFEKPFMNPARRPGPLLSANPDHPIPAGGS